MSEKMFGVKKIIIIIIILATTTQGKAPSFCSNENTRAGLLLMKRFEPNCSSSVKQRKPERKPERIIIIIIIII